jgi:hypothetical protein
VCGTIYAHQFFPENAEVNIQKPLHAVRGVWKRSARKIDGEIRYNGRDKLSVRRNNLDIVDINVVIVVVRSALALHSRAFIWNMESIKMTIVVDMTFRNR